jgi:hypothetical protein
MFVVGDLGHVRGTIATSAVRHQAKERVQNIVTIVVTGGLVCSSADKHSGGLQILETEGNEEWCASRRRPRVDCIGHELDELIENLNSFGARLAHHVAQYGQFRSRLQELLDGPFEPSSRN